MTNVIDNAEPEENLTDNLFGSATYEAEEKVKKDFLPWHKPRKQFVRDRQWSDLILRMVEKIELENNQLRYLGLPGDDLLDLRHFHDTICVPKNLTMKFLGFNRGIASGKEHNSDLEISLDEVKKLSNIDSTSDLSGDEFCQIGIPRSMAQQSVQKFGPYEIINIDLCDGFAKHPLSADINANYFETLRYLMYFQARRTRPWLLFITTRTDSAHIDSERFTILKNLYEKNLKDCESFLAESTKSFSINDREGLETYCLQEEGTSNIFLTSLCKWIISMAIEQNPPSTVELQSTIGYKIKHEASSPDLFSIAIKITPTDKVLPDTIGLTSRADNPLNEGELATKIIKRLSKQKDADSFLIQHEEVMEEMVTSSIALLEKARYDTSGYSNWAKTT